MQDVLVTGMGIISAIGNNLQENRQSLIEGNTGLGKPGIFQSVYAEKFPFGEVKYDNHALKSRISGVLTSGLTRTDLLAFTAFGQAIADASLTDKDLASHSTAFISASTVGGMCLTDQLYENANRTSSEFEYLTSYPAAAHALRICSHYNIKGFTDTINTACSSSLNSILLGTRLIRAGRAKRVIVGGTDSLAKYTVNGFNSLSILSPVPCRSFDKDRSGLNLGEGAAYLVLEAADAVVQKKAYAKVSGFGNSCDAYHASALSAEATGVIRSMEDALKNTGINASEVDYIHTHGTATENNDEVEAFGMQKVFGKLPPFNSTKTYTGHTLGAAGSIGAVYTILSLYHQELYPSLHFNSPIEPHNLIPCLQYHKDYSIKFALTNAFGFGGNCTSIIFGKA